MTVDILELLQATKDNDASDLHLSTGLPPMLRLHGQMTPFEVPPLTADDVWTMIRAICSEDHCKHFEEHADLDCSYQLRDVARFRVNVFQHTRGPGIVCRTIPTKVLSLDELDAPEIFKTIVNQPRGLVLVTGPTGSGKSTTLAAMINEINDTRKEHILTVEDPVEFVHTPKMALINQREVGAHTKSFATSLRAALREDPDIILVGEMRDPETIALALTAAETGHLVFGTLHTSSAAKTIDRVIDVFPAGEQAMVRSMLSESLRAVISQSLMRRADGSGRIAVHEIMIATAPIRNLIRENKVPQMYSAIQTGMKHGMQTLDQGIIGLLERDMVTFADAFRMAVNKADMRKYGSPGDAPVDEDAD